MKLTPRYRILLKLAKMVRTSKLVSRYPMRPDARKTPPFKLIFFCGEKGLSYLNASLISVYKHWEQLPDICIISDGSPVENIRKGLVRWPRKVEIIPWQQCAQAFKDEGNDHLHTYASDELLGKKFIGILYCAKRSPVLYSDSDVLWFNSPTAMPFEYDVKPVIKMGQDVGYFYTGEILQAIGEEGYKEHTPFNSGVVFLNGGFESYPKWQELCQFLGTHKGMGWFSEQTSFAILQNYFRPDVFFKHHEILIKIDDALGLRNTRNQYPNIYARHYVHVKEISFWRDFVYMLFRRKNVTSARIAPPAATVK